MARTRVSTGSVSAKKSYVDVGSDAEDYTTRRTWRGGTKKVRKRRDEDGNPLPPPSKKSRKKAKSKATKIMMKIQAALDLPTDVLSEIFYNLDVADLVALSRSSKAFHSLLLTKSTGQPIWTACWAKIDKKGLPKCPSTMILPTYAALIFETACTACGNEPSKNSSKADMDFGTQTILCKTCSKNEVIAQHSRAFKERYPSLDPRVLLLAVPRNSQHSYRRSDYVIDQLDEIIEALEEHDQDDSPDKISRMAFFNQRYLVAQNRLAEAKALNSQVASWRHSNRWQTRQEKRVEQSQKRIEKLSAREGAEASIIQRLTDEDYFKDDIRYLRQHSFTFKNGPTALVTDVNWPRLKKKLDAALATREKEKLAMRERQRIRNRIYALDSKYSTWRRDHPATVTTPVPTVEDLIHSSEAWRAYVEHVEDADAGAEPVENDEDSDYGYHAPTQMSKKDLQLWDDLAASLEATIVSWQTGLATELADLVRSPLDGDIDDITLLARATSAFMCKKCSSGVDAQPQILAWPEVVQHHCLKTHDVATSIVDGTPSRSLGTQLAALGPKIRVAVEQMLEGACMDVDATWVEVAKRGSRFFVSPSFQIPKNAEADEYKTLLSTRHDLKSLVRLVVGTSKLDVAPFVRMSLPATATREDGDESIVEWASCSLCATRIDTERAIWAHAGRIHGVVPNATHIRRFLAPAEPGDADEDEDVEMEVDDDE